ncbi:MAG: hypothetical protein JWN63_2751 [Candidatus Acidoferrum typicum]|nr:hypothetical protein [Candidatus Acidoferrum typicum]
MSATPQITRFPRPPRTLRKPTVPLNAEMELELNQSRLLELAACEADAEILVGVDDGMAQLLDPEGRRDIVCRTWFAEQWCYGRSDWKFEVLS